MRCLTYSTVIWISVYIWSCALNVGARAVQDDGHPVLPDAPADLSTRGNAMTKVATCCGGGKSSPSGSSRSSPTHSTSKYQGTVSPPWETASPLHQSSQSTVFAAPAKYENPAAKKRIQKQVPGKNTPFHAFPFLISSPDNMRWMKKMNYQPAPKPFEFGSGPSSSSSSAAVSPTPVSLPSLSSLSSTPSLQSSPGGASHASLPSSPASQAKGKAALKGSPPRSSSSSKGHSSSHRLDPGGVDPASRPGKGKAALYASHSRASSSSNDSSSSRHSGPSGVKDY
ncbi:unnamed protein product [Sympodiomycopsis kandeliae]